MFMTYYSAISVLESLIPLSRVRRKLTSFLQFHQPLHCPRLVAISGRKVGVLERGSASNVIHACVPIVIDVFLRIMLAKPPTD